MKSLKIQLKKLRAVVTIVTTMSFIITSFSAYAATPLRPISLREMYQMASNGQVKMLRAAVYRGLNANAVDRNGNTGLCHAILKNDHTAYNSFQAAGANPWHPCIQNIPQRQYRAFINSDLNSKRITAAAIAEEEADDDTYIFWLGAAALIAGGVALAVGGGGGGDDNPDCNVIEPTCDLPDFLGPDEASRNSCGKYTACKPNNDCSVIEPTCDLPDFLGPDEASKNTCGKYTACTPNPDCSVVEPTCNLPDFLGPDEASKNTCGKYTACIANPDCSVVEPTCNLPDYTGPDEASKNSCNKYTACTANPNCSVTEPSCGNLGCKTQNDCNKCTECNVNPDCGVTPLQCGVDGCKTTNSCGICIECNTAPVCNLTGKTEQICSSSSDKRIGCKNFDDLCNICLECEMNTETNPSNTSGLGYNVGLSAPSNAASGYQPVILSAKNKSVVTNTTDKNIDNSGMMYLDAGVSKNLIDNINIFMNVANNIDNNRKIVDQYMQIALAAYDESVIYNGANPQSSKPNINLGAGTVGMLAQNKSKAMNFGNININSVNGTIGMLATNNSHAFNANGAKITLNSQTNTSQIGTPAIIGMYGENGSWLTNNGDITAVINTKFVANGVLATSVMGMAISNGKILNRGNIQMQVTANSDAQNAKAILYGIMADNSFTNSITTEVGSQIVIETLGTESNPLEIYGIAKYGSGGGSSGITTVDNSGTIRLKSNAGSITGIKADIVNNYSNIDLTMNFSGRKTTDVDSLFNNNIYGISGGDFTGAVITNHSGGTINLKAVGNTLSSYDYAFNIYGMSGANTITNAGDINISINTINNIGAGSDINLYGLKGTNITNSGTINIASTTGAAKGAALSGKDITNSGSATVSGGIKMFECMGTSSSSCSVTNTNTGTISGGAGNINYGTLNNQGTINGFINAQNSNTISNKGTINNNIKNTDGNIYGIYAIGDNNKITNEASGRIVAKCASGDAACIAYGIYANGLNNTIVNNGIIEVTGNSSNPDGAVGIYANGTGTTVTNTGTITINTNSMVGDNANTGNFIKVEGGATYINSGVTRTTSNFDFDELSANGGKFALGAGGSYVAEQLSGDVAASNQIILNNNLNQYEIKDAFVGEDKGINIISDSFMFKTTLEKSDENEDGIDVVGTRISFEELLAQTKLAGLTDLDEFLESNYVEGNNQDLLNALMGASNAASFDLTTQNVLGLNYFPSFAKQSMDITKQSNIQITSNVLEAYNKKDENITTWYDNQYLENKANGINLGYEVKTNSSYTLFSKKYDKNISYGVGFGFLYNQYEYDNDNLKKENTFHVFAPMLYQNEQISLIVTPQFGYGYGDYKRYTNSKSFEGDFSTYYYGVGNQLSKHYDLGYMQISPVFEFNVFGAYQNKTTGNDEIKIEANNNILFETGAGVYASKDFKLANENAFKIKAGAMYYQDLNNPYSSTASVDNMIGSYNMPAFDNDSSRLVLSLLGQYTTRAALSIYASINKYIESDNDNYVINFGLKYAW